MTPRILKRIFEWSEHNPARAGSIAGLFHQGCTIGVAVLLIPVTTSFLSPEEAGLWFSFQGLVAMVVMVDLGFGLAISRQAAFTLGYSPHVKLEGDFIALDPGSSGVTQLFLLTRRLYAFLAGSGTIITLAAYEIFTRYGNLIPPQIEGARFAWYGISFATVILIFTGGYAAFLNGIGAVYQTRLLAGIYQLAAGIGAGIAAWLGGGLVMMSASFAICSLFYTVTVASVLRRKIHTHRSANTPGPPRGSLRRLARIALPIGAINIFGSLVYMVQTPILGMILGPEKVVPFYLAQKIGLAFNMMAMQFALPQLPFFTRKFSQGEFSDALTNLRRTLRRTGLLVLATSTVFYFASPWMALSLLNKSHYVDPTTLLFLSLDFLVLGLTSMGGQYVLALGRNPFVWSTILTGTASLLLTIVLTSRVGVLGLPLATLIAGLFFNYRKSLYETIRSVKLLQNLSSQAIK